MLSSCFTISAISSNDILCCFYWGYSILCWKVVSSFASAAIRIRTAGITKFIGSRVNKEASGNISQYDFGLVLKETMLNLGPTFIKGIFLVSSFLLPPTMTPLSAMNMIILFLRRVLASLPFFCLSPVNSLILGFCLWMQLGSPLPQGRI